MICTWDFVAALAPHPTSKILQTPQKTKLHLEVPAVAQVNTAAASFSLMLTLLDIKQSFFALCCNVVQCVTPTGGRFSSSFTSRSPKLIRVVFVYAFMLV